MGMDFNLLLHSVEGWSRLAAVSVVSGLWQGLVLAAGVGICLRLVPKTTAAIRFAVWTVVFAVLALLPLLHAYGSGGAGGTRALVLVDARWSFAIAALWLMVSAVRGIKLAISAMELHGIWRRASPVDCDAAPAAAEWRGVTICTSADVDRPSVIGFFSPRILIPQEMFDGLTARELEQIVLHEAGHLRRGDDWMNLLQKISLVLVPLNPVLMWIERRLCFERELACDDAVLRLTKAPKAYASCLTSLAEQRLGRRAAALSLGAWERRSELARRVHSILSRSDEMSRAQAGLVMGVIVLGLAGGAVELSRCPLVVSFSDGVTAALPAEALSSASAGAEYQAVAFHPVASGATGVPHETLLKASMPSILSIPAGRAGQPMRASAAKRHPLAQGATLIRTKQSRAVTQQPRQMQRWLVLTTWRESTGEESVMPRMVLTVSSERGFSSSYAAVPTEGGWLVLQL